MLIRHNFCTVGRSVCLCATSSAKTVGPIEMPFAMWSRVGQRNHVLDGGPDPHTGRGSFEDEKGRPRTCWDVSDGRYTQQGQNQYPDCGVLDGVLILYLANTIKPTMCGGDAVLGPYVRLL